MNRNGETKQAHNTYTHTIAMSKSQSDAGQNKTTNKLELLNHPFFQYHRIYSIESAQQAMFVRHRAKQLT